MHTLSNDCFFFLARTCIYGRFKLHYTLSTIDKRVMKELKRTALQVIIGFEVALVLFFYLFGKGGIHALRHADALNKELLSEIKQLDEEIAQLQEELDERQKNPFYKESIARKELQMAYKNETVYLLPEG